MYQPGNSPPQSRNNGDLESAQETLQRKSGICHFVSNDKFLPSGSCPAPSQSPVGTIMGTTTATHLLAALHQRETANTRRLIFLTRAPVPSWQPPNFHNRRKASSKCKCTNHHITLFYSPVQVLFRRQNSDACHRKGRGAGHSTARDDTAQLQVLLDFSLCHHRHFSLFPAHL